MSSKAQVAFAKLVAGVGNIGFYITVEEQKSIINALAIGNKPAPAKKVAAKK